jgi:putative ABC transport system permease protein
MTRELTLFSFALKNLSRKKLRTGILIIAISLLACSLVFAMSFVKRVNASIKLTSERLGADILIVPAGSRGSAEDILLENQVKSFYMDMSVMEKLKTIEGIAAVTPQTYLITMPSLCCGVPEAMVIAFNQNTDFIITPWLDKKLKEGLKKGEAVVGSESALNLDLGLVDVDSVLFGSTFKIVGVLGKTGTGLDNAIFISDDNMPHIIQSGKVNIKPGQISIVFAKVKKGHDPYKVARSIEDSILEVDTVSRKDIGKNIINALSDINKIFYITVILASILSIFLVWAIFSAIANERAREVGIMRAIGAKESQVVSLFFIEVVIVGAIGSLLGIVFGNIMYLILAKSFSIIKHLSAELNLLERSIITLSGFVIGTAVCIIGALLPVQRLKKLEPLIVIKGESQ